MGPSRLNNFSEHNNEVAGIVTSPTYPSGASLWSALLLSERRHCQNIGYAHLLHEPHEADEFNSNGFAAGIINSVLGTTNAPIHTYYECDRPVPVHEFQRTSCAGL